MRSLARRLAPRLSVFAALTLGGTGLAVSGCSLEPVESQTETITDPSRVYARLTLNYNAVNLSTNTTNPAYHTLQLVATPRDALGDPMTTLPAPTFRSLDTARVEVTPTGLIKAKAVTGGTPVAVVTELTDGPVTHRDTAQINVAALASPPQLATLSIQPVDSAVRSLRINPVGNGQTVLDWARNITQYSPKPPISTAYAADAAGNPISGLVVEYVSLDPKVGRVLPQYRWVGSNIELRRPGRLRIVARTFAYGVAKEDTATITVIMPIQQNVSIRSGVDGAPVFEPSEVRIAPYGLVFVANYSDNSVDVTFDDDPHMIQPPTSVCSVVDGFIEILGFLGLPTSGPTCTIGDMVVPPMSRHSVWSEPGSPGPLYGSMVSLQVRQFSVPGVYRFHDSGTGLTGRVVVSENAPENSAP